MEQRDSLDGNLQGSKVDERRVRNMTGLKKFPFRPIKLANTKYTSRLAEEKRAKAAEETRREEEASLALKRKRRMLKPLGK